MISEIVFDFGGLFIVSNSRVSIGASQEIGISHPFC